MHIDFDDFSVSQKIYSVAGAVLGILVYMNNKDHFNVALGLVLLSWVIVFLMRYRLATYVINSIAVLALWCWVLIYGTQLIYPYWSHWAELYPRESEALARVGTLAVILAVVALLAALHQAPRKKRSRFSSPL